MDEKRLVKFLWIVKACLLAVLLYAGVAAVAVRLPLDLILPPSPARGEPQAADPQAALSPTRSPPDYALIVQRDLLGTSDAPADAPSAQTPHSPVPAQELNLGLIGTIAGGPATSRAIIQEGKSNAVRSYRIGDTVAGATVEAIERDAVVLRYQDRPLVLQLGAAKTDNGAAKAEERRPTSADAGPRGDGRKPSAAAQASSFESARAGYMAQMFRQATIEPYVKNQRTQGLKISGLEQFSLAEKFGLRNGDVIQTINGQQLTSKQKAFQVLMKARTQPKVSLQLLRDGQSKELSFDL